MNKRDIVGFIAARHGVIYDEDDPAFAFIAVQIAMMEENENRLKAMMEGNESRLKAIVAEHERRLKEIQSAITTKDPTAILEDSLRESRSQMEALIAKSESDMQLVIENGVKWTSDPTTKAQWWAAAAFCSLLLFALGFMLGASR